MLEVTDISTFYGRIQAIAGISLTVNHGEVVCLIGNNGAGKSTTLMTISGVIKPAMGKIAFDGAFIQNMPAHEIAQRGIIQVPEGRRILPELTVLENLDLGGFGRAAADRSTSLERVMAIFPRLKERRQQAGGTLSGGEQQMLAIGRAIMAKPKLLILDEPSLGLAPIIIDQIFRVIADLNAAGTTILLVEQNASLALDIAHRGYVMETGKIVAEGKAADLRNDPALRKAYLGL